MSKEKAYEVLELRPDANYYEILGVEKNASHDEIRKKYKKLSLKYHPDKYKENEEVFKLIGEAGTTLGDEDKRKTYNLTLQDKDNTKALEVSAVDLETLLKQSKEFFREEVQKSFAQQRFVERITVNDLDAAIEAGNDLLVIGEISARIMDCVSKTSGNAAKNKERIEDMLSYAPEGCRVQIEEMMIKGVSSLINDTIKQGSGYITDDSKSWKKVEDRLNSMPEKYRVEIVSEALKNIDNTSRRDRLVDMLPR